MASQKVTVAFCKVKSAVDFGIVQPPLEQCSCRWSNAATFRVLRKATALFALSANFLTFAIRVAGVLKLVDKPDLGSGALRVWVRVPSPAPQKKRSTKEVGLFLL